MVVANHIYRVMQRMNDGGAIYTLGNQPGTVIQGNHLHDFKGTPGGIYLDEGSGFIEVTSNVVYGVHTPINYNNRAQDRIKTCREHDNYLLDEVRPHRRAFSAAATAANLQGPATKGGLAAESTFEEATKPTSAVQAIMDHAGPASGN